MTRALPFTVIGGYLGAGKTTLLNHLLTGAEGLVQVQDDPDRRYVYQHVGRRWTPEPDGEWGEAPRLTRLVVIGLAGAVDAEALQALL